MNRRQVRPASQEGDSLDEAEGGHRGRGGVQWDDALYAGSGTDADGPDETATGPRLEGPARTAATLDAMAGWLDKAQRQLDATAEATARIEASAEARPADVQDGSLSEALSAIRRIENRLKTPAKPAAEREPAREPVEVEKMLGGVQARLDELAAKLAAVSQAPARRPLKQSGLRSAVDEIRSHQEDLERDPFAPRTGGGLPALGTLARSQTAMLTTLREEITKLATRIEDAPQEGASQRDVETLRRSMSKVARRDDLKRLEQGLEALTSDIGELRRAGERASEGEGMAALQAEIRRLAERRGGADVEALQAEIRRLAEHRADPVDITPIARDIDGLSRKIDRLAEGGVDPAVVVSLSDQIDAVRTLLTDAGAPQALGLVDQQLAALRSDIAEFGGRQIGSREVSDLRATIDDLRASLEALGERKAPDVERAVREFGQPIEATLAVLVEKIERVEQRVSDPTALDHLERQIQSLAARMGGGGGRDPAIASLERAMGQMLEQVSAWREGAVLAAERAARSAVAETLDAMPVAAEVERHLAEIGERYAAAEERTLHSLATVQTSLADVMTRLSSLEGGSVRRAVPAPRPAETPAAPQTFDEPAMGFQVPLGDRQPSFVLPVEDEVLLEPGARPPLRPKARGAQPPADERNETAAPEPAETPDIKSSFIAAARRAAQAAAAEAQAGKGRPSAKSSTSGSASASEMVGRVRRMIDSKRRPLLLAAAAIVLALGAMSVMRMHFGEGDAKPAVATAPPPAAPALATAPPAPLPAPRDQALVAPVETTPAERGDTTAATTPAPDPATTQSITREAPSAVAAIQPKEPARIAEPPTLVLPPARPAPPTDSSVLPAGLKQAADRGNPVALYDLAARTAEGRGVPRDPKAAFALFEKAADKGLVPAQYRLGNSFERGIGATRDVAQAKVWYRRSAEAGNVRAMHNLAVLLADGGGAKPDFTGAVEWFSRAAEHGVRDSQFNLAVLYARGLGTSPDLLRAYHWLAVAALQGDDDAGRKRDEVANRLSPSDLAKAKAGVERWQATPAAVPANEVLVPPGGFPDAPTAGKRHSREARV